MKSIKSFESFVNEGLTDQYLNPINEGWESSSYTYRTEGTTLRPMQYADAFTKAAASGQLTKAAIPGWISRYGNFEGQTSQQVYASLIANPALAEVDAILVAKAQKSGTAEELAKWKADPAKQLLYAILLVDLSSDTREEWRKALDKNRSSVVVADVQTKSKVPAPGSTNTPLPDGQKPNAISVPFSFAKDGAKGDVFVVNEWIISNQFKAEIDAIVKSIKETTDKINPPSGKPKAFLDSITIESSCSTAPNGTPKSSPGAEKYAGKTISFMDLSKERANAVLEYVKTSLTAAGVLIDADTKVQIKAEGQNGDGTSGPAWNTVEGTDNVAKLAQVKKYQMAKADFVVMFNDVKTSVTPSTEERTIPEVTPAQMVEVTNGEYKLVMSTRTFSIKLEIPRINFDPFRPIKNWLEKRRWGSTKCYKW